MKDFSLSGLKERFKFTPEITREVKKFGLVMAGFGVALGVVLTFLAQMILRLI
jgi:hypothetical protein